MSELILTTQRATYWEVEPGVYQATKVGEQPKTVAGYRSLLAIMQLKGEPWETRLPYMIQFRYPATV